MTMGTGRGEKGRLPVCGVVSSSSSSLSMRVDRPCGEKRRRIGAIPRRIVLLVGKGRTGFFLIFIFVISHRIVSEGKIGLQKFMCIHSSSHREFTTRFSFPPPRVIENASKESVAEIIGGYNTRND